MSPRLSRLAALLGLAVTVALTGCASPPAQVQPPFATQAAPVAVDPVAPVAAPDVAPASATTEAPRLSWVVAASAVDSLPVYDAPDGTVVESLGPYATYGSPRTLLAVGDIGSVAGWLEVQLPERWGHEYGWVRLSDVTVSEITTRIDVYLDERELDVTADGEVVMTVPVAIGEPATPTPLGLLYVTERIQVTTPRSVYGPYVLALSGYSDSFTSFRGGKPQLAIHGTNAPSSIGLAASNGCVRVANETITALVDIVPLGTPVEVHARRP